MNNITGMTDLQLQDEITRLEAANLAITLKMMAIGTAGSLTGLYVAFKQNKGIWVKIGYMILGGMAARIPGSLIFLKDYAANLAQIESLKREYRQRHPQISLYEELTNK